MTADIIRPAAFRTLRVIDPEHLAREANMAVARQLGLIAVVGRTNEKEPWELPQEDE
jgi:hypothetical protein